MFSSKVVNKENWSTKWTVIKIEYYIFYMQGIPKHFKWMDSNKNIFFDSSYKMLYIFLSAITCLAVCLSSYTL